jgi:hypothetical protein
MSHLDMAKGRAADCRPFFARRRHWNTLCAAGQANEKRVTLDWAGAFY